MKDQWNCVLNDLEEIEGKEFIVLMGQYSIEFFLVSSSTCHATLPPVVKLMRTIQEMFLKIIFSSLRPILRIPKSVPKIFLQSPEFDRPIFFSRSFSMSKKSIYSFCHWVSLIELSSWFNIEPFSFKNGYGP